MDATRFWDALHADAGLDYLGVVEDGVGVLCRQTGTAWWLAPEAILEHDESLLWAVLHCRRNPRVITQVSRIVGYYSFHHAWNRSKLAELDDRHRGDYGLPGGEYAVVDVSLPHDAMENVAQAYAERMVCRIGGANASD